MTLAARLHGRSAAAVEVSGQDGRSCAWVVKLVRFAMVGGGTSVVQLAMYAFLADAIGSQAANASSWLVSTLVATEAHRRYSFRTSGESVESDHAVGIVTSVLTLLIGTAALAVLDNPTGAAGVLALVAVNGAVGLFRFVALHWWMVGRRHHDHHDGPLGTRVRTGGPRRAATRPPTLRPQVMLVRSAILALSGAHSQATPSPSRSSLRE